MFRSSILFALAAMSASALADGATVTMFDIDVVDAGGNVVSFGYDDTTIFNLVKDDSGSWFVHRADISRCVETPWGFAMAFELRDHVVDGEWQFQVIEQGPVESCE